MVKSLRERSGLEEAMTEWEESAIHPNIHKVHHPTLKKIGSAIRSGLGIKGENAQERLGDVVNSLARIVGEETARKKKELGGVTPEGSSESIFERSLVKKKESNKGASPQSLLNRTMVSKKPSVARTETRAKEGKVSVSSGDVFDIGDLEGIMIGEEVLISIPKGKDVYFLSEGIGTIPSKVKKLKETI